MITHIFLILHVSIASEKEKKEAKIDCTSATPPDTCNFHDLNKEMLWAISSGPTETPLTGPDSDTSGVGKLYSRCNKHSLTLQILKIAD